VLSPQRPGMTRDNLVLAPVDAEEGIGKSWQWPTQALCGEDASITQAQNWDAVPPFGTAVLCGLLPEYSVDSVFTPGFKALHVVSESRVITASAVSALVRE